MEQNLIRFYGLRTCSCMPRMYASTICSFNRATPGGPEDVRARLYMARMMVSKGSCRLSRVRPPFLVVFPCKKTMALRPAARIAPSMLSSDFSNLSSEAARMVALGADWLHMDVMVRCYARELSLLPSPLISCFLYCLFVLLEGLVVSG